MIGSSRYYNLEAQQVTVGYTFLCRKYWGGSFNRELKSLMLNHAFQYVETILFEIGAQLLKEEVLDNHAHCTYTINPTLLRNNLISPQVSQL